MANRRGVISGTHDGALPGGETCMPHPRGEIDAREEDQ